MNIDPNPGGLDMDRTLFLVPTSLELDLVQEACQDYLATSVQQPNFQVCGFGPIAAGVETSRLVTQAKQNLGDQLKVVLLGIAGTYDATTLPVGGACSFHTCGCYGIGAGQGDRFQSPSELGFPQIRISQQDCFDRLPVQVHQSDPSRGQFLLTVCSAAANQAEVQQRRSVFPQAMAEDMEGFGVAMATGKQGIPLTIIRGISNVAGDRNTANWKIRPSIQAAVALLFSQ